MGLRPVAALSILCLSVHAQPTNNWRLTESQHFELYSQADDATARSALLWFEQLRAFYLQKTGLAPDSLRPVRVIGFRSAREYEPYRLRPASDAHYIGTEGRDYIVMASLGAGEFSVAAHEYAHSILHAAGLQLPPWFSEGLAEFFSTVRISAAGCTLGGDLPARSQALQRHAWIPLSDLLALPAGSPLRDNRETAGVFYAESWALADMLVLSPDYGARFGALMTALASGTPGSQALTKVYGKSLDTLMRDLHAWTTSRHKIPAVRLPGIEIGNIAWRASEQISPLQARSLMADMLLAAGELDRAEALYRDLAREAPQDAGVSAALGTIALRKGDHDRARQEWKRAIDLGITDAALCYRYVALAELTGLPAGDLRPALERAVSLKPDFDDARYHLALLEKNDGHYETALAHLRAMRTVAPTRAFNYWIATADSLIQLERREEAQAASKRAMDLAATPAERAYAAQLAYVAQTDLAVQFTSGPSGRPELATTRVPHQTANWNPFIEPGDRIRHVEGALQEIDCSGAMTRFVVQTSEGRVTLAIADPGHVQMRNAPSEFTCGPQPAAKVAVDYAVSRNQDAKVDGVVRGMEFR